MSNEFFEMHSSPEKYDEVHDTWLRLTRKEVETVSAPKSRIYISILDIDIIQNSLQYGIENDSQLDAVSKRRMMQMGYSLEEIKYKLKKRTAKKDKN